jgi:F-type H+-transporting ATPase subunit b
MRFRSAVPTRKLLVVATVAAASLFVLAPAAGAASPDEEHGEHLVECVENALADHQDEIEDHDFDGFETALEDCSKAKSLFSPNLPELIWGGLAFLIVAIILVKYGFPTIRKTIEARQEKITNDLDEADRLKTEAAAELEQYRSQIAGARDEANRIVEEARTAADEVRRDVVARAEADAADIRQRANEDARLAAERAMQDLRSQVADISIGLAEKIVERNLDAETQQALIESYISSVGGTRS